MVVVEVMVVVKVVVLSSGRSAGPQSRWKKEKIHTKKNALVQVFSRRARSAVPQIRKREKKRKREK